MDALQPLRCLASGLGVEHHVEVGLGQAGDVVGAGVQGRGDAHVHAQLLQQPGDLDDVVTVAKAQGRGPEQVAPRPAAGQRRALHAGGAGNGAHHLVEGFGGAPVLLALVGGQFQRHHRHRQLQRLREPAGIVLDQLGGAGRAHQHGLGRKALVGLAGGGLEQLGGVAAQVARLEGGVGHGRAAVAPLDHGEQQVCIGVALWRVQHVMHVAHGGGDAHRAHMRGAFVGPEGQLHAVRCLLRVRPVRRPAARAGAAGGQRARPDRRPARSHGWARTPARWPTWWSVPRPPAGWPAPGRTR